MPTVSPERGMRGVMAKVSALDSGHREMKISFTISATYRIRDIQRELYDIS
jgi:hypothetical protein